MDLLRFYFKCVYKAFRQQFKIYEYIVGFIASISPIIIHYWPETGLKMTKLLWLIPSCLFSLIIIMRLLFAPYWVYKELKNSNANLKKELKITKIQLKKIQEQKFAVLDELAGPYLRGLSIRIIDIVPKDNVIRNRTFEDCHIYGPAILTFFGNTSVLFNKFDAPLDNIFITVSIRKLVGVIVLENCTLLRCQFHNIGLVGPSELKDKFIKK